jgi:hypothetical protein
MSTSVAVPLRLQKKEKVTKVKEENVWRRIAKKTCGGEKVKWKNLKGEGHVGEQC